MWLAVQCLAIAFVSVLLARIDLVTGAGLWLLLTVLLVLSRRKYVP